MPSRKAIAVALFLGCVLSPGGGRTATRRIAQFENESVRVWKTLIDPQQPLTLHRHEHGRVIVALRGGTLKIVQETGRTRRVTWETGKAYWLPADPPGELHGDVNEGEAPIEVMVVEVKP
jgi:quercetin dioxygenase-like cupin family protein